jgi:hypothetical protein
MNVKYLSDKNFMGCETTWEQERREVLESVGEELRQPSVHCPGIDACFYLLDHLGPLPARLRMAGVPVRPAMRKDGARDPCGRRISRRYTSR